MVCYDSAAVPVTVQSPGAHCRVFPVVFVAALPKFTVYPPGLSSLLHRLDFIAPSWGRAPPPPFRRDAVSLLLAGGMVCSDICLSRRIRLQCLSRSIWLQLAWSYPLLSPWWLDSEHPCLSSLWVPPLVSSLVASSSRFLTMIRA